MKYFRLLTGLAMCLIAVCVPGQGTTDTAKAARDAARLRQYREAIAAQERPIAFYGKVVDQEDKPVAGATVEMHITRYSSMAFMNMSVGSIFAQTDASGAFEFAEKKGIRLSLRNIDKPGYEYRYSEDVPNRFDYSGDPEFVPDRMKPVVFRVRKRGATAFLISNIDLSLTIKPEEAGKFKGMDFIQGQKIPDSEHPAVNGVPLVCDLKYAAISNADGTSWTVALASGDPNGGVLASDRLYYEAPVDGYQPAYIFDPRDRKPPDKRYLYVKSRNPAIYARIDFKDPNANGNFMRLNGNGAVNPYGERILDAEPDVPGDVAIKLKEEARSAFRKNERPVKPDLSAMILEWRLKHPPKPAPAPDPNILLTTQTTYIGP